MTAAAQPTRTAVALRLTPAILRDAMTRIPSAHFLGIEWAKDAIAVCGSMLAGAVDGDSSGITRWVTDTCESPHAAALFAVFCGVCDAFVADAFRSRSNVSAISTFIVSAERDVLARLTADRRQKEVAMMNDPGAAELAAGLVRIVHLHDRDTATHLDATAALARRIATVMQLPSEQVMTIEFAARLHDIGKVGVRKEVLCKPGALSNVEWTEMRLHSELGAAALLDTPKLAHLAPIVRAHHERIDGTGYPDRLGGNEIPLEARVVAVADAFHAMTTERPYRRALMPNEALGILAEHAGRQFDADVVEATFTLFRFAVRSRREIA